MSKFTVEIVEKEVQGQRVQVKVYSPSSKNRPKYTCRPKPRKGGVPKREVVVTRVTP